MVNNLLRITAAGGQLAITGDSSQRVTVGANGFFRTLPQLPAPRVLDLLMIAVGAYASDRMILRHGRRSSGSGIRTLHLSVAVSDPAFWSQADITERVLDALHFLTDDNWSLSFEQSPEGWYQSVLPFAQTTPDRVALFSEGLDSAAGVASQALKRPAHTLLVTVGHYVALRKRAERQLSALSALIPGASFQHAGLLVSLRGGVARQLRLQERTQRSRAFLFCSAAIAAACACQLDTIDVFENGAGAINFPLMTGMLVGGLATRGAHPSLLAKMSKIGSLVSDRPMSFGLPYGNSTKGELVSELRNAGLDQWLQQTRSCIHTSIRIPGITHCGVCPGCIERRVAFYIAGIAEDARHYDTDVFSELLDEDAQDYMRLLVQDSSDLLSSDDRVLRRLDAHLRNTKIDAQEHARILFLLRRNAKEVTEVFGPVQERLLRDFYMNQGRRNSAPMEVAS